MPLSFPLSNTWRLPHLICLLSSSCIITCLSSLGFNSSSFLISVSFKWLHFYACIKMNFESISGELPLSSKIAQEKHSWCLWLSQSWLLENMHWSTCISSYFLVLSRSPCCHLPVAVHLSFWLSQLPSWARVEASGRVDCGLSNASLHTHTYLWYGNWATCASVHKCSSLGRRGKAQENGCNYIASLMGTAKHPHIIKTSKLMTEKTHGELFTQRWSVFVSKGTLIREWYREGFTTT